MWLDDIEDGAMLQAMHVANLPFAFMHVAMMPDAHQGFGMPIGTVLATRDTVIPNAVGVDIGCGMHLIKTDLTEIDKEGIVKIMADIRKNIPLGFKHRDKPCENKMPKYDKDLPKIVQDQYESATKQIGTLGGGNHFIEIQKSDDGHICAMIHSGSRNIGFKTANYYNKLAKDLNSKWHTAVPKDWDLASLPIDTDEARAYIDEMEYCVKFAAANRTFMMEFIKDSFQKLGAKTTEEHDVPHNYAALEKHFGKEVWVHRKGATSALEGQLGLIPGSQGTSSYIVEGLGNMFSFKSCSHGAGRRMGRNVAKKTLNLEEEKKKMDDQGIIHSVRNVSDLDEASGAYKDIDKVMENQKDLVKIVTKLSPLAVVKG